MTTAQIVETSVTNNSSFQNYSHPDDHITRTTVLYLLAELIQYIFLSFRELSASTDSNIAQKGLGASLGLRNGNSELFLLRDRYSSPISSASLL